MMRRKSDGIFSKLILVVLSVATILVALASPVAAKTYAFILVGSGRYGVDEMAFHETATRVKKALETGWALEEGKTLKFICAWETDIVQTWESLHGWVEKAGEEDVFLFYYIGHGSENSPAMKPWRDDALFYALLDLNYLSLVDGKKVVILDACHAGKAHGVLSSDTWLLTSCGDEQRRLAPYPSCFSTDLAGAIKQGETSLHAVFEAGNSPRAQIIGNPQWYPASGREDLEIVPNSGEEESPCGALSASIFQEGSPVNISKHFEGTFAPVESDSNGIKGTAQIPMKVRIGDTTLSLYFSVSYVLSFPSNGKTSQVEIEMRALDSIIEGCPISLYLQTSQQGELLPSRKSGAQNMDCSGEVTGWIQVGDQKAEIKGTADLFAQVWSTSSDAGMVSMDLLMSNGTIGEVAH